MPRRRKGDRVQGPYEDSQGWYCNIFTGGERTRHRCDSGTSEAKARAIIEAIRLEIEKPTLELSVREAAQAYVDWYVKEGADQNSTANFELHAIKSLLDKHGDLPVHGLRDRHIAAYLEALPTLPAKNKRDRDGNPQPISMATSRSYWKAMVRTSRWWFQKSHTRSDLCQDVLKRRVAKLPWATKLGKRRINRGKKQLRNLAEVESYLQHALAQPDLERRVATVLPLLTGISSGELRHLTPSQIDFRMNTITIRSLDDDELEDFDDFEMESWEVKTANRVRDVELPACIQVELAELCEGRAATEYIFQQEETTGATPGAARGRDWLLGSVKRVCRVAGVRVICAHGLRDTFASVQRKLANRSSADIGELLGHGRRDDGRTAEAHYIGARVEVPALQVVFGGDGSSQEPERSDEGA